VPRAVDFERIQATSLQLSTAVARAAHGSSRLLVLLYSLRIPQPFTATAHRKASTERFCSQLEALSISVQRAD